MKNNLLKNFNLALFDNRFSTETEHDYQRDLGAEKIRMTREASILAIFLYFAFGILDIWTIPSALHTVWWLRLSIIPVVGLVLLATGQKDFFVKHYQIIVAIEYLYMGCVIEGIIYVSSPTDIAWLGYYVGLILVMMGLYSWTFLPPSVLIMVGTLMLGIYGVISVAHQKIDQIILVNHAFFLVSANIVGIISYRERTRYFRENYQLRRSLYQELQVVEASKQELARTDLMKSQFLASMSHELRTPLNAIINFTELVAMGAMGEVNLEQKSMLNQSLNGSRHLLQLINDVLDISKIQAGKLTLFVEENVQLEEEIETVLGIAEPLLQKQKDLHQINVQLIKEIDQNLPPIHCDRRRVRQVLLNLLSNAVKFTDKGSITLSVKRGSEYISFAVKDTGMGISEDLQERIFEPFIQTEHGVKHAEGTGLGLPISRNLVEAHGGKLWLESSPQEGTTFYFTLPVK